MHESMIHDKWHCDAGRIARAGLWRVQMFEQVKITGEEELTKTEQRCVNLIELSCPGIIVSCQG